MLLNSNGVKEKIKSEIKWYIETNENDNTTYQNLGDAAKALITGKLTALQAHLNK